MPTLRDYVFGGDSSDTADYYAREADRQARGMQLYGGNAAVVELRCFKYYHPDQGSFLTDLSGRDRWLGPKASRIWAIAHRSAGTQTTMTAIAQEAMCCVSTVSRALTRLQAFGLLAVDVKRGRGGGITVRLATAARQFRAHIDAAWRRIRSWIKVASRSAVDEVERTTVVVHKDATFTTDMILTGEITWDEYWQQRGGWPMTEADKQYERDQERYAQWGREVIAEMKRLDDEEPDWDLQLEKIRASVGWE